MKIRFLFDCELVIVTDYILATDEAIEKDETFHKGDETEIDILSLGNYDGKRKQSTINVQFGDGSCAYGVPMNLFEIIDGKDELQDAIDEAEEEQTANQRRNEKRGLYSEHEDISN